MTKNERKQRRQEAAIAREQRRKSGGALSRLFSLSLILHLLDLFTNKVYAWFERGLFGKIFTSYSLEEKAFENGFLKGIFKKHGSGLLTRIRATLSRGFERSYFLDKLGKGVRHLFELPLRTYGNLILSFGVYSLLVNLIKQIVMGFESWDWFSLSVGLCCVLIAIPAYLSKESLGKALRHGVITRSLFVEAFGFNEEDLNVEVGRTRKKANYAIIVGMLAGLLTFAVKPIYFVLGAISVIVIALVMASPEIGVLIAIFAVPFCSFLESPSFFLSLFIILTAIGYGIKLVRGKRIFVTELIDVFVILFMLMLFMSGLISAGGAVSLSETVVCCSLMLGYFLLVNLMRTQKWIDRCVNAVVSSGVITAAYGVVQYLLGEAKEGWIDTRYFTNIDGRVVSSFDNPNVLAAYLVIVYPFLLLKLFGAKSFKGRLLAFLCAATVISCAVLTYSRSAWIAILAISVVYGLINSRKTFKWLFALCFVVPFLPFVLPSSVTERFLSIGDISETSNFYRVYTWRGTIDAIKTNILGGFGYGMEAYEQVYPKFAYAGIEAAEHSHNLYLQIIFSMGMIGLVVFAVIVFLFAQKNFELYRDSSVRSYSRVASAAFVSVLGALIVGLFDLPWYNYRVFFMFWIALAVSLACIRVGIRESKRQRMVNASSSDRASIDI